MTGKERIFAALNGTEADRIPVMLHNFMMAATESSVSMREYRESPEVMAAVNIEAVERYALDGVLLEQDTVTLAGALGAPVDFPEHEPARSNGALLESLDEVDDLVKPDLTSYRYLTNVLEACKILRKHFGDTIAIRGNCDQAAFSLACSLLGPENFLVELLDEDSHPQVYKLLDFCAKTVDDYLELMAEAGADILSNGDSPAGPDLVSPKIYEEFAFKYEKQAADTSHRLGKPYFLHICGNTELIIDTMIRTDADAVEIDYKTPLDKCVKATERNCTFIGNIDPSGVLALGTPELVREKTKNLIQAYQGNPRFILNAGCALPSTTPPENVAAMLEVCRDVPFKQS